MEKWYFENGVKVIEVEYSSNLHAFEVWQELYYAGTIYPADIDEMDRIKNCLETEDPITGHWEDGLGNSFHPLTYGVQRTWEYSNGIKVEEVIEDWRELKVYLNGAYMGSECIDEYEVEEKRMFLYNNIPSLNDFEIDSDYGNDIDWREY